MTENANPKPFNKSRQKCQRRKLGRTALLGLSISQSINKQIRLPSNWQNRIQKCQRLSKNVTGSFTDWVNPLFVINYKMAAVICKPNEKTDTQGLEINAATGS